MQNKLSFVEFMQTRPEGNIKDMPWVIDLTCTSIDLIVK